MNSLGPVFFSRTPAPSEPTDRPRRGATVPPDPSAPSLCPLSGGDDQQVLLWDAFSRCAPPCPPGDPPTARPPRARAPRPVKALLGHAGIILCAAWDTPAGAGIVSCDSDGMARPRRRRGEGGGAKPIPAVVRRPPLPPRSLPTLAFSLSNKFVPPSSPLSSGGPAAGRPHLPVRRGARDAPHSGLCGARRQRPEGTRPLPLHHTGTTPKGGGA